MDNQNESLAQRTSHLKQTVEGYHQQLMAAQQREVALERDLMEAKLGASEAARARAALERQLAETRAELVALQVSTRGSVVREQVGRVGLGGLNG